MVVRMKSLVLGAFLLAAALGAILLAHPGTVGAVPPDPGGGGCPGGGSPSCVQCADDNKSCVQACYGDYTCGETYQGLCYWAQTCGY